MERKRINVTMYKKDLEMLEELTRYFNINSYEEVTQPSVMRNAIRQLYIQLEEQGKLGGTK